MDYKNVLLHAVSRPDTRPSLYLQIELDNVVDADGQELIESADLEEDSFLELNIYPTDEATLDDAFVALSECAALHPCDEDSSEEEDSAEDEEEDSEQEQYDESDEESNEKSKKVKIEQVEDAHEDLLR